eukprot:8915768-Alexandrium_andersonii.AAC.1
MQFLALEERGCRLAGPPCSPPGRRAAAPPDIPISTPEALGGSGGCEPPREGEGPLGQGPG